MYRLPHFDGTECAHGGFLLKLPRNPAEQRPRILRTETHAHKTLSRAESPVTSKVAQIFATVRVMSLSPSGIVFISVWRLVFVK
jgi:hypothetical protein